LMPTLLNETESLPQVKSFLNFLWIWHQKENGSSLIDEFKKKFDLKSARNYADFLQGALKDNTITLDNKTLMLLLKIVIPDFKKAMKVKS